MAIVSKTMFTIWRALQILTLIPIWGMLAYFVHRYDRANATPPVEILVLFIVSLIATAWALLSFFQFHHSASIPLLVFIIDMLLVGGFIASTILLRGIRNANCTRVEVPFNIRLGNNDASWGNNWVFDGDKECIMMKTSWALGLANLVMFFITAVLALLIYRANKTRVGREKVYVERGSSEYSHGHRAPRRRYW